MSEIEKWIVPNTLVIFDLDNTLFEANNSVVAHANWFHDMLRRYPNEEKKILDKAWKAIAKADYKPVEEITPKLIKKWQEQGIAVMALTSRNMVLREPTLRQVKQVGVDFSVTSPKRVKPSKFFQEGILFADVNYPKGLALKKYLEEANFKPARIILVDDLKKNLTSVCVETGAIGLYYPLVDNKRHLEWDEVEAERHWWLD